MRWMRWVLASAALFAGVGDLFVLADGGAGRSRPALSLHYIANAGVLVEAGEAKVLIDALFDRPNPAYRAPTADTIEKMVAGTAPFDGVGLALVTHNHPDHFDARVALRFLEGRREAVLVAPADAVEAMRSAATDWARVAPRVVPIDGPAGSRVARQMQGVSLTAMRTRHGSSETPPNVMYLVEANGWRLFHEGDSPGDVEEYRRVGLGSAPVDLAFVHFWFPFEPNCARFLEETLRPDHVALTHLPVDREGDFPTKVGGIRQRYKDLILLLPGMAARTFADGTPWFPGWGRSSGILVHRPGILPTSSNRATSGAIRGRQGGRRVRVPNLRARAGVGAARNEREQSHPPAGVGVAGAVGRAERRQGGGARVRPDAERRGARRAGDVGFRSRAPGATGQGTRTRAPALRISGAPSIP